jgi:NADH:ubiquinone oxidoreductase subunit F (NADH-binding)
VAKGEGVKEDIEVIEELSSVMKLSSLCGLGQGAPVPVMDTLNHFRKDYENRIDQSIFLRSLKGGRHL